MSRNPKLKNVIVKDKMQNMMTILSNTGLFGEVSNPLAYMYRLPQYHF